jgi:multidrug transporter EmrE-like cation transporter
VTINSINSLRTVALFLTYVAVSCAGLFFIKITGTWKSATFLLGFSLYAGGAVMWMVILRLLPLSFAFPIAAGSLVVGTMLTGAIFLKEAVSIWQSFGTLMIIAGIFLIAGGR